MSRKKTPARWLASLPAWDGTPRIDTWLTNYLGVAPGEAQDIGVAFLVGAVARALFPGHWFPFCLVLEGDQGLGKSMAVQILGGKWYGNADFDLGSKDSCAALSGKWLYEFAEMGAITRAEASRQKSFLSRQVDEFRPVYGRREIRLARQVVFVGTSNTREFALPKENFWPVVCTRINHLALIADRKQLFAEAIDRLTCDPDLLHRLRVAWSSTAVPGNATESSVAPATPSPTYLERLVDWAISQKSTFTLDAALTAIGVTLDYTPEKDGLLQALRTRAGVALRKAGCRRFFAPGADDSTPALYASPGFIAAGSAPDEGPSPLLRPQAPLAQTGWPAVTPADQGPVAPLPASFANPPQAAPSSSERPVTQQSSESPAL